MNQDSVVVSQSKLSETIYVADFFYTSCPSICPTMAQQLLKVHDKWKNDTRFKIVSFSLDPDYDTPSRLKEYAFNLGIDTKQWMFLNGKKDLVYQLAEGYFTAAVEDKKVPGGILHSGKLILIDKEGHIRGFYDGTEDYGIEKLLDDIPVLLQDN